MAASLTAEMGATTLLISSRLEMTMTKITAAMMARMISTVSSTWLSRFRVAVTNRMTPTTRPLNFSRPEAAMIFSPVAGSTPWKLLTLPLLRASVMSFVPGAEPTIRLRVETSTRPSRSMNCSSIRSLSSKLLA